MSFKLDGKDNLENLTNDEIIYGNHMMNLRKFMMEDIQIFFNTCSMDNASINDKLWTYYCNVAQNLFLILNAFLNEYDKRSFNNYDKKFEFINSTLEAVRESMEKKNG